jgi:hypothetical protein
MSVALELIQTVKANGGRMRVDGDSLVIAPDSAALPIVAQLREHKGEIIRLLEGCPADSSHDPSASEYFPPMAPDAWQEDFIRWAGVRCVLREEHDDSAGIGALLVDFAEWCAARNAVPARRDTFERLLQDAGFPLKDGLACGLVLKVDLEAVLLSKRAPAGNCGG